MCDIRYTVEKNGRRVIDRAIYTEAMNSTAPGAVKQKDVPSATPNAGTTAPAGKSTSPEPFKYRFGTSTVKDAAEVPDAKKKAFQVQEGTNLGTLPEDYKMSSREEETD